MKKVLILIFSVVAIAIISIIVIKVRLTPMPTMNVTYIVDSSIKSETLKRCEILGDIAVKAAMMNTLDVTVDNKTYRCNFKVPEEVGARDQIVHFVPKEADIMGKYKELGFGDNDFINAVTICSTKIMSDGTCTHTGRSVSIVSTDRFSATGTERLQAMDIDVINGWPDDYGSYSALMEGLCNGVSAAEEFAFSNVRYADYVKEISKHLVDVGDLSYGHKIKFAIVTERQYVLLANECEKLKKSDNN